MGKWIDLVGTSLNYLKIGLAGVRLKNNSGNLEIRNNGDSADASLTTSKVNISGDVLDINSDAAGSGADWKYTIQRPSSGMTEAVTLTLPVNDGSAGQALMTDGDGNLSWASAGDTSLCLKVDAVSIAHNSSSPLSAMTLPQYARIMKVLCRVTEAFNGTAPTASVGISGMISKYLGATSIDLKTIGLYEVNPSEEPASSNESIIVTLAGDSSSAGSASFEIYYAIPA